MMSVRRFVPVVGLVVLALLSGCGTSSGPAPAQPVPAGTTPPSSSPTASASPSSGPSGPATLTPSAVPAAFQFNGTTLDGKSFDGSALAGKPAVLWFWAPWCPKCRAQAEVTAKVAKDFEGRVNFVGVAGLDKQQAMRDFVADRKVGGFTHLADEPGTIWKKFEIVEQSTYVLLDANGTRAFSGYLPAGDGLADRVAKLAG